ncbi:MutS-related protein [Mycoplasma sp. P36-A1]|uniref:MutS-related protein n=1 Tax=Mycoplasma sp. P36-A1 TaxID=3252900 RepID=UPI003C2DB0DF
MNKSFYTQAIQDNKEALANLNKKSNTLSFLRFASFFISVICFSLAFADERKLLFIPFIIFLLLFLYLVEFQNKIIYQIEIIQSNLEVSANYFCRLDDSWQSFPNNGIEFLDKDDLLSKDLDLVGKNSLFQYINISKSRNGQKRVYEALSKGLLNKKDIKERNEAVNELANNSKLYLKIVSLMNLYNEKSELDYLNNDNLLNASKLKLYKVMIIVQPIIILLTLLLSIYSLKLVPFFVIALLLSLVICAIGSKYNRNYLDKMRYKDANIKILTDVMSEIEEQSFEAKLLQDYLNRINQNNKKASKTLNSLKSLKEKVESMNNGVMYLLLEALCLYDYQIVFRYDNWKRKEGLVVNEIIDFYHELELLLSLGVISQSKEHNTIANIVEEDKPYIDTCNMYHPLINQDKVIVNNFESRANTIVITGSNMSGKTTFIRTIGINLALVYAGANVCSLKFDCSIMKIMSSIRIEDDYSTGVSTFYAEIKRIKEMVEYSNTSKPMIALIDEIFMGTNSADRIYGASKALKTLSNPYSLVLVTTHDFELTKLENVLNFHFKEYYENNQIMFNYKLLDGPSTTRNARYLLQMAGITTD